MKVLLLYQFSDMGGAQMCLADLTPALLRAGWDVRVALPGPGPLADFFGQHRVPVHFISCGPYTQGAKTIRDILRFTRDYRTAAAAIARLSSGMDLIYVNGPRLLPSATRACGSVPVLFHSHSRVRGRYTVSLIGRALRKSRAKVIASSRFVAEPWLPYTTGTEVVYNGTPEIAFRPKPPRQGRPWSIGVIGRISPEKGQLEFVRAARRIAAGLAARFVIHGAPLWSPAAYAQAVRDAAAGLDIDYLGWDRPVASTLHELDLLVVPSISDESTTRVIPEAFSAGTPVVAFPSGGIPEIVRHGVTGLLAESVDVKALASAIRDAIGRATLLPGIVSAARRRWESDFTLERYCAAVVDAMRATAERINGANRSAAKRTTQAAVPSTGP
jgi:glycosyltransferase involved in cell wall biosynthesis